MEVVFNFCAENMHKKGKVFQMYFYKQVPILE